MYIAAKRHEHLWMWHKTKHSCIHYLY